MVDGINPDGNKPKADYTLKKPLGEGEFEQFGKKYRSLPPLVTSDGKMLAVNRYVEVPSDNGSIFGFKPPEQDKSDKDFPQFELPKAPEAKTPDKDFPQLELPKAPEGKKPEEDLPSFNLPKGIGTKLPDIKAPEDETKPEDKEKAENKEQISDRARFDSEGTFSKDYAQGLIDTYGRPEDYTESTSSKGYPRYVNKNTGEIIGPSLYQQLCKAAKIINKNK